MTRSELMALVAVRKAEIEAHETDLVEVLTAARAGLTPTPTQGAPWDAETRYIAGDTGLRAMSPSNTAATSPLPQTSAHIGRCRP